MLTIASVISTPVAWSCLCLMVFKSLLHFEEVDATFAESQTHADPNGCKELSS